MTSKKIVEGVLRSPIVSYDLYDIFKKDVNIGYLYNVHLDYTDQRLNKFEPLLHNIFNDLISISHKK